MEKLNIGRSIVNQKWLKKLSKRISEDWAYQVAVPAKTALFQFKFGGKIFYDVHCFSFNGSGFVGEPKR